MHKYLNVFLLALFATLAFAGSVQVVKIIGQDENFQVDVIPLGDGTKALRTSGLVQIEQLFGQDPQGSTWFYIGGQFDADGVGSAGDTVRVTIGEGPTPLNTVYPAVDVTTTVTAGMLADSNPERALATQICLDLDGDPDFVAARWDCIVMKDFSGVFIASRLFNEFGTRKGCVPLTDCFNVVTTGTTSVTITFNEIERRGLGTELQRSPNDPRQGVLGVSGSFVQQPGGTGDLLFEELENGGSPDMAVDGSITPVLFRVECDPVDDKYISNIRWFAACNGPKLDTWLCANSALTNGVDWTIRSEGDDLMLLPVKNTNDMKNKFALGDGPGTAFRIDLQSGEDSVTAELSFPGAAIIKKCGTNGTGIDDYVEAEVNDNLTGAGGGNVSELEAFVFGFRREP